jgi:small subunit ribosomal protein S2
MSQQIKELLEAGVHFGHKTSKWCPKMKPFIWGAKNKVYFIDVAKTAFILNKACEQVKTIAANGGKILWVGTKVSAQKSIKMAGEELDMPTVSHRWIGGCLTNFEQVKKGVARLLHLRDIIKKPAINLKKKEIVRLRKEMERLEKNVGGIAALRYPPAAMILVDVRKESTALKEAISSKVPVIGLVDTNSDPSPLTIAIPTNDDSEKAISYIIGKLVAAAKEGVDSFKAKRTQEKEVAKSDVEKTLDKETKGLKARDKDAKAEDVAANTVAVEVAPVVEVPAEITTATEE